MGHCIFFNNDAEIVSGIKSHKFVYPGNYFESDAKGGDFTEDATLYFEVGITSLKLLSSVVRLKN